MNPMVSVSAGATNLFSDITTAIESPNRGQYRKNTPGRNEFIDFKQFGVEHPPRIKSILAMHSDNHPGLHIHISIKIEIAGGDFNPAPRPGIEIAPASECHDLRGLSPSPASLFQKIEFFDEE